MRFKFALPSLVVLFIFTGCGKKENVPEASPAMVETTELAFITPVSAKFTGKILKEAGSQRIEDHGFVYWIGAEGEISAGTKISLGADPKEGFFIATVNDLKFYIINNVQALLVVKAYVTDKNGTRYGKIFSNNFKGALVSATSAVSGKAGEVITITGNFGDVKANDIKVTFGATIAKVTVVDQYHISVTIPNDIPVGHGTEVILKVQIGVISTIAAAQFVIFAKILDINPKSGPIGARIDFTGYNLPTSKDAMSLLFGEHSPYNIGVRYFDQVYYMRVPAGIIQEKVKIYETLANDEKIALPFEFTVTPMVIKSVTPNPALENQEITIELDNIEPFNTGYEPYVHIGDQNYFVSFNEDGDLTFRPEGLLIGKTYPISISYGPHTVNTPIKLTIAKPEATGFSPKQGYPGTAIHITGKFAKGVQYPIDLDDGSFLYANAISDSELLTFVGIGIKNKNYSFSIKYDSGNVKIPGVFRGQPIRFDAVIPASGPPGSTPTITGEGFFDQSGSSITANFGGAVIHTLDVTLTKMVLDVPTFTEPGVYPIKLSIGNVIYDTGLMYTVTQ